MGYCGYKLKDESNPDIARAYYFNYRVGKQEFSLRVEGEFPTAKLVSDFRGMSVRIVLGGQSQPISPARARLMLGDFEGNFQLNKQNVEQFKISKNGYARYFIAEMNALTILEAWLREKVR